MQNIKPKKFVTLATSLFSSKIKEDMDFTQIPSIMLWGQPGVGKTASIFSLADSIEREAKKFGKRVKAIVTTIDLTLYNPVDLRGIPTANETKTAAIWLKPYILDLKTSMWIDEKTGREIKPASGVFASREVVKIPDGFKEIGSKQLDDGKIKLAIVPVTAEKYEIVNLFFMDELSAALASLQVCAYQITHDRRIGEHKLPSNTYPICAGNRTTDKSVAYAMPKALANRVIHLNFDTENFYEESWLEWAVNNDIDQRVIAFLGFSKASLNKFDANSSEQAFATPRSWENVSKILKLIPNLDEASPLVAGTVGEGVEVEFRAFCRVYTKLPRFEQIANGEFTQQFTEPDIKYAISTMILTNFRNADDKQVSNLLTYIMNMTPDFSAMTGRALLSIVELLPKFISKPEWKAWLDRNNKYLRD